MTARLFFKQNIDFDTDFKWEKELKWERNWVVQFTTFSTIELIVLMYFWVSSRLSTLHTTPISIKFMRILFTLKIRVSLRFFSEDHHVVGAVVSSLL